MMDAVRTPSNIAAAAVMYAFIDSKKLLNLYFPVLFHNAAFYSSKVPQDSNKSKSL